MPGSTFSLPAAYAAAAVVVADGAMTINSAVLNSASAAFTVLDEGKTIKVEGAGAAGVDLTTTIQTVISATRVILATIALTTVTGSDLTYIVGVYRLRNLLRKGDLAGNVYSLLYAQRLAIQVNSASPGSVFLGGRNVTPTNAGAELGVGDNDNTVGRTLDDFVTANAASSLLNIQWTTG